MRIARRVSPRTSRKSVGLSAMRSIVSSSAARNSAPSPGRRPLYQSRVSSASAPASGLKLTRRLTLDPSASGGRHPRGLRTQDAERAPSSVDPAPQPPRASTRARPHVRPREALPQSHRELGAFASGKFQKLRKRRSHRVVVCQYTATVAVGGFRCRCQVARRTDRRRRIATCACCLRARGAAPQICLVEVAIHREAL